MSYWKIILFILLVFNSFKELHGSSKLEALFPGATIDSELLPLIEDFVRLSDRGGIQLPLNRRISQITIIPHEQLLATVQSRKSALALTTLDTNSSVILLSDRLRANSQELKMLLFHELLHAAGFDHPKKDCDWAETGCGIMGRSPFEYRRIDKGHAEFIIRQSFAPLYLSKLPRLY